MIKTHENKTRLAYKAPETNFLSLSPMMESCVSTSSFDVNTETYGVEQVRKVQFTRLDAYHARVDTKTYT